jgi:large subunit ribosomal protein L30
MAQTLKIRQIRSTIGVPEKLRKVVRGLGLRKIDHTVERPDNPATWGMVRKVPHLVEVVK